MNKFDQDTKEPRKCKKEPHSSNDCNGRKEEMNLKKNWNHESVSGVSLANLRREMIGG